MQKRLQAVTRILAVQQQLGRLAEAKLADLDRRVAALQASQRELVGALNEDAALHGLFVEAMARRVRSISSEIALVERAKEAQAKHLLEETGKLRRVERIAGALGRECRTAQEKNELAELIDRLKPASASLP
ncbi:MAG: hypothetical protein ACHQAY_00985 [Hyphomicrobiales bacterium]